MLTATVDGGSVKKYLEKHQGKTTTQLSKVFKCDKSVMVKTLSRLSAEGVVQVCRGGFWKAKEQR